MIELDTGPSANTEEEVFCKDCSQTKPRSMFHTTPRGKPYARCRPCRAQRSKAQYAAAQEALSPEIKAAKAARADRMRREAEAKQAAKDYAARQKVEAAQKGLEIQHKRRMWAANRKRGLRGDGSSKVLDPKEVANNRLRADYLALLLADGHPTERIANDRSWEAAISELRRIWPLAGNRDCNSCGENVAAHKMRPPIPGSGRQGMCIRCSNAACDAERLAIFGPYQGPQLMPMRDGTSITLAEFASRVYRRMGKDMYAPIRDRGCPRQAESSLTTHA